MYLADYTAPTGRIMRFVLTLTSGSVGTPWGQADLPIGSKLYRHIRGCCAAAPGFAGPDTGHGQQRLPYPTTFEKECLMDVGTPRSTSL
jgi:hypothetical protein